nr:NEW3 domain-containing protein [Microtetraspora sp. NBRC 16547]
MSAPEDWTVETVRAASERVHKGEETAATFKVTVPPSATAPGRITGTVSYGDTTLSDARPVTLAAPTLAFGLKETSFTPGQTREVTVTFANKATRPLISTTKLSLAVPQGWTATPGDITEEGLKPGESRTVTWRLTAPASGLGQLTASAAWTVPAGGGTASAGTRVAVIPETADAVLALDLGSVTSPVAPGYRRLASTDAFDATRGYGWVGAQPQARDRSGPDTLRTDFAQDQAARTLRITVPAGEHMIHFLTGDQDYANQSTIVREGNREIARLLEVTPPGVFTWLSGTVDGGATGHTVDLTFAAERDFWKINAIIVS